MEQSLSLASLTSYEMSWAVKNEEYPFDPD